MTLLRRVSRTDTRARAAQAKLGVAALSWSINNLDSVPVNTGLEAAELATATAIKGRNSSVKVPATVVATWHQISDPAPPLPPLFRTATAYTCHAPHATCPRAFKRATRPCDERLITVRILETHGCDAGPRP